MKLLIIYCHPDPGSLNAALLKSVQAALTGRHEVKVIDLYAEQFDPILTLEERTAYLDNTALIAARVQPHIDLLRWAEGLVFVYPTWFYGVPALLKGWFERVWLPGVAFLPPARKGATARPGMQHIRLLIGVTTSGSPWWWLRWIGDPGKAFLLRGIRAICAPLCKTKWLQLHNMNNVTLADRERFLARVTKTFRAI